MRDGCEFTCVWWWADVCAGPTVFDLPRKISADHVVFMPLWMPKRPRNVDLTKDEDCDMLSYGARSPFHLHNFTEAPGGAGGSYLWACSACCAPHHFVSCVCCSGLGASSNFGVGGSNQHLNWTLKLRV